MGGNIFALQLRNPNPQDVLPISGIPWDSGLRSMLSVREIHAKLQTTVLFGDSLFMMSYDIGQLSKQDGFSAFLKNYYGKSIVAAELDKPPYAAVPALYNRFPGLPISPPDLPISIGPVTILSSGFDPLRGFWIEFAGNFFLTFPIFKDFPNVVRDTQNYKGAQPSANNPNPTPGSGGSGGGGGGTGSGSGSGGSSTC